MRNSREIAWLKKQLPIWIQQEIISSQQAEQLTEYYELHQMGSSRNIPLLIGSFLGALLIGGGIILLFAFNWEHFTTFQRTLLSFAPLVLAQGLYGFTYFYRRQESAWVEGASLFLMLMLAACISLISQTYHMGGTLKDFLWIWMLLSIPLLYLLNASLCCMLLLMLAASWAVQETEAIRVAYWGFFLSCLPHCYYNFKKEANSLRNIFLAWTLALTFIIGYIAVVETGLTTFSLIGVSIGIILYYFIRYPNHPDRFLSAPFRTLSLGGIIILGLVLTYEATPPPFDGATLLFGDALPSWAGFINFLVLCSLLIGGSIAFYRFPNKKPLDFFIASFPLFCIVWFCFAQWKQQGLAMALANIYVLGVAGLLIQKGIQQLNLRVLNTGTLYMLIWITARFFDTSWSFVLKGFLFIALGIAILLINIWVTKNKSTKNTT
ncbi:MAG: DUF2157 domain-containing protein [Bacteroidota bacterium]